MSQITPGDQGSGQRPGSPPGKAGSTRKATPGRRPPAKAQPSKAAAKGRPPGGGAGKGPAGGRGGPPGKGPAGKAGARPNKAIASRPPRRFSPSTMAFAAVGVVVVIVLVFVIVKVTGGSSKPSGGTGVGAPQSVAASPSIVSDVTGVTPAVIDAVGTGQGVVPPTVPPTQPPLTSGGRPEVLFIGAEFCPYCAAERWAMVNAFSRFGTWTGLQETTSSPWDTPPAIATFSFRDAKLTSQYFDFVSVEHQSNDTSGLDTRTNLQPLTAQQSNLWTSYSSKLGLQGTGYPFVDFGNKVFVTGPSYNPATLLLSLSQPEIAAKLKNPNDPVTQAIVGTANYLTAAVCSLTGDQPTSVCSASGVKKAMTSLKLS